jgi:hypothetical protein
MTHVQLQSRCGEGVFTLAKLPKMCEMEALEASGTLKMANCRFRRLGMSFLPPPGTFMHATYLDKSCLHQANWVDGVTRRIPLSNNNIHGCWHLSCRFETERNRFSRATASCTRMTPCQCLLPGYTPKCTRAFFFSHSSPPPLLVCQGGQHVQMEEDRTWCRQQSACLRWVCPGSRGPPGTAAASPPRW